MSKENIIILKKIKETKNHVTFAFPEGFMKKLGLKQKPKFVKIDLDDIGARNI